MSNNGEIRLKRAYSVVWTDDSPVQGRYEIVDSGESIYEVMYYWDGDHGRIRRYIIVMSMFGGGWKVRGPELDTMPLDVEAEGVET